MPVDLLMCLGLMGILLFRHVCLRTDCAVEIPDIFWMHDRRDKIIHTCAVNHLGNTLKTVDLSSCGLGLV